MIYGEAAEGGGRGLMRSAVHFGPGDPGSRVGTSFCVVLPSNLDCDIKYRMQPWLSG